MRNVHLAWIYLAICVYNSGTFCLFVGQLSSSQSSLRRLQRVQDAVARLRAVAKGVLGVLVLSTPLADLVAPVLNLRLSTPY